MKEKFKTIRKPARATAVNAASKIDNTVEDFRSKCLEHIELLLPAFLDAKTRDELYMLSEFYGDYIGADHENDTSVCDFTNELGITIRSRLGPN